MFPTRYFPNRMFALRYFPKVGAEITLISSGRFSAGSIFLPGFKSGQKNEPGFKAGVTS